MKKKLLFISLFVFVCGLLNVNAAILNKDSMPLGSYIIGEYLFTRNPLGSYGGDLKTEYIMIASKSIQSSDASSLRVYQKTARGNLINAITGETVTDISERDLLDNVKYYNLKEIPTVNLNYIPGAIANEKQNYSFGLETYYNDEDELNDLDVRWDMYGAKEWDGVYPNLNVVVLGDDDSNLHLLQSGIGSTFNFNTSLELNTYYSYIAYPYFYDDEEKMYLACPKGITLYAGPKVKTDIVNNKMEVSVLDVNNYTIEEVEMYASKPKNEDDTHITMQDLLDLASTSEDLRGYIDNYYIETFNKLASIKGFASDPDNNWYLAEIYKKIGTNNTSDTVYLGDFGNYEKEEHDYYVNVRISSPDILNGQVISLTSLGNPERGVIYQEPVELDHLTHYSIYSMIAKNTSFASLGV